MHFDSPVIRACMWRVHIHRPSAGRPSLAATWRDTSIAISGGPLAIHLSHAHQSRRCPCRAHACPFPRSTSTRRTSLFHHTHADPCCYMRHEQQKNVQRVDRNGRRRRGTQAALQTSSRELSKVCHGQPRPERQAQAGPVKGKISSVTPGRRATRKEARTHRDRGGTERARRASTGRKNLRFSSGIQQPSIR